jgi:hypothetical protein
MAVLFISLRSFKKAARFAVLLPLERSIFDATFRKYSDRSLHFFVIIINVSVPLLLKLLKDAV